MYDEENGGALTDRMVYKILHEKCSYVVCPDAFFMDSELP